ncbi:MAG TPA: kelch repeat-containing protein [Acidimicrobiales bacterium]|nr:kelch repeat-containing protein [Acidimicrobiales bacterium]
MAFAALSLVAAGFTNIVAGARASATSPLGTWSTTGSTSTPRAGASAVVLGGAVCQVPQPPAHCGKVLVAGGLSGLASAAAELYDPAAGQWAPTASMRGAHGAGHLAVMLADGRVLVAGGGGGTSPAGAEVYDPLSDTWSATASPAQNSYGDGAALLLDGRVLRISGEEGFSLPNGVVAELYNPSAEAGRGAWAPAASPIFPQGTPTVTVLEGQACADAVPSRCGQALVVGAGGTELYDPVLGVWAPTLPPVAVQHPCDGHACHTSTLLADGRVLVLGGDPVAPADPTNPLDGFGQQAQVYDPSANSWAAVQRLPEARSGHTASLLPSGEVLVAGGAPTNATYRFDPDATSSAWEPTGFTVLRHNENSPYLHAAASLADGRVLVVGGVTPTASFTPPAAVEVYDPASVVARPSVLSVEPRVASTGTPSTVTISGYGFGAVPAVRFGDDPATVVSSSANEITVVPADHAPATVDVTVTTSAGTSATMAENRFSWHAPSVAWTATTPGGPLRSEHTATSLPDGTVLVAGGKAAGGTVLATAELYDPLSGSWRTTRALATARAGHAAVSLADGRLMVTGGVGADGRALASTEIYDAGAGTWRDGGSMVTARQQHTATLLGSGGSILVTGGSENSPTPTGTVDGTLASSEIYQPGVGQWTELPSPMNLPRRQHRATLLDAPSCSSAGAATWCHRVLVTGGDLGPGTSAELFDPASGTWAMTGSMLVGRAGHLALARADPACADGCGIVLSVGGSASTLAERYVPSTGRWVAAGRLHDARSGAAGAALADGSFLLVGGTGSDSPAPSAEVFDSSDSTWSLTKTPATASPSPSATVLPDGRVLVSGVNGYEVLMRPTTPALPAITGVDPPSGPTFGEPTVTIRGRGLARVTAVRFGDVRAALAVPPTDTQVVAIRPAQAQGIVDVTLTRPDGPDLSSPAGRYTYASGAWINPTSLVSCGCQGRSFHAAAALPDGRVLVTGGTENFLAGDRFEAPEGEAPRITPFPVLATADIYDPTTRAWSPTGAMSAKRFQHTATALRDGTVLVVGGQDERGAALGSAERYDPASGTWSPAGRLTVARLSHTATLLADGRVLVSGGATAEDTRYAPLVAVEVYDPTLNLWASAEPMTTARAGHTATSLASGKVLVTGGLGGPRVRVPSGAIQPAQVGADALATAEVFDSATGRWNSTPPMGIRRSAHTATLLGGPACTAALAPRWCGDVLIAGGTSGAGGLAATEIYQAGPGTWEIGPLLRVGRSGHTASALDDGKVLLAGGGPTFPGEATEGPVAGAEVYDPEASTIGDAWNYTTLLTSPRAGHAATTLPDGSVLVSGGYRGVESRFDGFHDRTLLAGPSELYTPAPHVRHVLPASGPVAASTPVTLRGSGFSGATDVRFGAAGVAPTALNVVSKAELTVVAPARAVGGPVEVSVSNAGGTSAHIAQGADPRFIYVAAAGRVVDLLAAPVSATAVRLTFTRPDDGAGSPAVHFVIEQAGAVADGTLVNPIRLCTDGVCDPPGIPLATLLVEDLAPGTPYFYVVRARGFNGELGPPSPVASATTLGASVAPCAPALPTSVYQVTYPGQRYSLVGAPSGTIMGADGPLYAWFDLGAGGRYEVLGASTPTASGRGYWAWFACSRIVDLAAAGPDSVQFDLGPYHAAMIGNPARQDVHAHGQDFAARWDAGSNDGFGGYVMSSYQETLSLAPGEGAWAFSYSGTRIEIAPKR